MEADPQALAELRTSVDRAPDLWKGLVDLTRITTEGVIKTLASGALGHEAMSRQAATMRDGIGYRVAAPPGEQSVPLG
jgi:hypothetical protein